MYKGMIFTILVSLVALLVPQAVMAQGEIYKVVNPDGSVTFTDQKPSAGAEPVELAPLSVVETDIQVPDPEAAAEEKEPTTRDLRREFRDFKILQPQNEETFWGAGNMITISWGASQAIPQDLSVALYVDGRRQAGVSGGSHTMSFDRGEHQAYAVLMDGRNRRLITAPTVTFFVKQHSANFNRPVVSPRN